MAVRVFINTTGKNKQDFSQEFLDFMKYINATTDQNADATISDKIKLIHNQVKKVKLSEKMGVKYMQLWEEKAYIKEEGLAEGLAEGRSKGLAEGINAFILDYLEDGKSKKVIIDKLIRRFSLSEEEAQQYYEKSTL